MRKPAQTRVPKTESRAGIIASVTTPLGFFVLVVLVVEAGIGGLAMSVSVAERGAIIQYIVVILVGLIVIVSILAFFRPETLYGQRSTPSSQFTYSVVISAPTDLE